MTGNISVLRSIPKIDELLKTPLMMNAIGKYGMALVIESARAVTEEVKNDIISGRIKETINTDQLLRLIESRIHREIKMRLRPVINGTGIILHTNLGRAVLCEVAAQAAYDIARNYSTLEYDCSTGERGSRYSHIDTLLEKLCGCESAIAVNNNAAAVLLILSTIAKDKEVVVSRGELVEIGGAFRVPEIMQQSGSTLIEVGTTNKTYKSDYVKGISSEKTAALLKVHTSNYKIMGFTDEVSLEALVDIGNENKIPVIYDLGSGAFFKSAEYHLNDEPNITDSMKSGVDILCFSGDKLLGGPQVGIIAGKKKYIDAMKKNPLTRAIRIDKMTLAALEATLRLYLDMDRAKKEIPTLVQLGISQVELMKKAKQLQVLLKGVPGITAGILEDFGQVGGGSMPTQMIPSVCVSLETEGISVNNLNNRLNQCDIPIVGRIQKNRYLLDVRTIEINHFVYIAKEIKKIFE